MKKPQHRITQTIPMVENALFQHGLQGSLNSVKQYAALWHEYEDGVRRIVPDITQPDINFCVGLMRKLETFRYLGFKEAQYDRQRA